MSLQQCLKYIPQMPFELDKNGVSVCVELARTTIELVNSIQN